MNARSHEPHDIQILDSKDWGKVSGGIIEAIEPGDEFLTIYERYLKSMEGIPIVPLDNPLERGRK